VATRPRGFLPPVCDARDALESTDAHLRRIQQDVEDGMHGLATDPNNNAGGDGDGGRSAKRARYDNDGSWYDTGDTRWQQREPEWGYAAKLGIWASEDGKSLAFDNAIVAFETAPDLKNVCAACLAPKGLPDRNKWCVDPAACWAHGKTRAHERIAEFPDDVCKGISAPRDFDWTGWTAVVKRAASAVPRGGRNGDGRGAGRQAAARTLVEMGGGGGKGAGGEKGKGGRGKGDGGKGGRRGGGKGKGKGGKGDKGGNRTWQRFGRP